MAIQSENNAARRARIASVVFLIVPKMFRIMQALYHIHVCLFILGIGFSHPLIRAGISLISYLYPKYIN